MNDINYGTVADFLTNEPDIMKERVAKGTFKGILDAVAARHEPK